MQTKNQMNRILKKMQSNSSKQFNLMLRFNVKNNHIYPILKNRYLIALNFLI